MSTNVSIDQVMAYLCSLTIDCKKDNPTRAEAEMYSKTERSLVTPSIAIEALDAVDWQDCLNIYHERIESTNNEGFHATGVRYTRRELMTALNTLWKEYKGNITQAKVITRAKIKPTPSWTTLIRHFGQPSSWAQFIDPAIIEKYPEPSKAIKIEIRVTLPGQTKPIVYEINQK